MTSSEADVFRRLRDELERLRTHLTTTERCATSDLTEVAPQYRASAVNLLDYLVTRRVDLRPVQLELWKHGLSSLGRLEGHVRDALDQVIARLDGALGGHEGRPPDESPAVTWEDAERLLHRHTRDLFGPKPSDRHVYVMVTAPEASEVDEQWARGLIECGMNVLRVNGAHEGPPEWERIVHVVRRAADERGASVRVLVDLPGPKLRTVAPRAGAVVERWKPKRDQFGRVVSPHRVLLLAEGSAESSSEPRPVPVPAALLSRLAPGDELFFVDARGRNRRLVVAERTAAGLVAELDRTAYVVPETTFVARRGGETLGEVRLSDVAEQPFRIELAVGDRFRLEPLPVAEEARDAPFPVIGCSLKSVVDALHAGARVLFDDGKLECVVEARIATGVLLRVTHAPGAGFRLCGEKGINVPDTRFDSPTLGPDDERALAFAAREADMVGASFVRDTNDVRRLYQRLGELSAERLGVVLKIETAHAFKTLPAILLAAMARYPIGVMIARGDLAVEVGVERLAELQEEILWLCEAAHVPVIWATQVLDRLAHTGSATRAEITDAAMSVRAECVMLNKGPHVGKAVETLVNILRRMERHQYKKRNLYRKLQLDVPACVVVPAAQAPD